MKSEVGRTPWSASRRNVGNGRSQRSNHNRAVADRSWGKMAFEVASVKQAPPSLATAPASPLTVGGIHPTGGRFLANFPLVTFIVFA